MPLKIVTLNSAIVRCDHPTCKTVVSVDPMNPATYPRGWRHFDPHNFTVCPAHASRYDEYGQYVDFPDEIAQAS